MRYQIKDLTPDSTRVDIVVKLIRQFQPRQAKGHVVISFLAADPTGQVPLPFWDRDAEVVKVGDYIQITQGYVAVFRDQLELRIGKYGGFRHIAPPPEFLEKRI